MDVDLNLLLLLETLNVEEELEVLAVLLSEENDDDIQKREVMPVDINFWRTLGDPTFYDLFRMSRVVFENLIVSLGNHLEARNRIKFLRTPLDVALMSTIWVLASSYSFRSISNHFGKQKSVVYFNYKYIIKALREMSVQWVQWPGPAERDFIKTRMEELYGYPGAVGCIDCCHIKILAPQIQPQNYINRHHDHSIVIQAVCDNQLLYRDFYVGETGSVGDIRTFYRSPLCHKLFVGEYHLSEGEHLLGDGAYPLSPQVMIPFVNNGRLTRRQRAHNLQLSSCRCCVERSFALFRGKWRRLKHLVCSPLDIAIDHIVASIVLHNFVILQGELPVNYVDNNLRNAPVAANVRELCLQARGDGAIKREYIAEYLHPQDN